MSGSNTRTLHWWESEVDAAQILSNDWQFNIAKFVTDLQGKETSNVIWQSAGLAPMVNIAWEIDYALNWTAQLPQSGVNVTIGGSWQPCAPGDSYDLDVNGFWVPSGSPGKSGWLSIGDILYSYNGLLGIHIVVGVKNADTGNYDPIYIDHTVLPKNSSAAYQPQEKVQWWLAGGTTSGSVYSETQGAVDTKDYSVPASTTGNYEWWTTYTFSSGTWIDTQTAPPNQLLLPPSRDAEFFPLARTVIFNVPIELGMESITTVFLKAYLSTWYVSVEINWTDLSDFRIVVGPNRPGANPKDLLSQFLTTGDEDARINQGLKILQSSGDLPANATWAITPSSGVLDVDEADREADTVQQTAMHHTAHHTHAADSEARRAKKLAAASHHGSMMNGTNPAQRRMGSAQSVAAY